MIFTFCACKSVSLNSYLRWLVFNQKHNVLAVTFHSRSMPPSWGRMVGGSDWEGQKPSRTNWRGTYMIFITLKYRNFVSIWVFPCLVATVVWPRVLRHCQPVVPLTRHGLYWIEQVQKIYIPTPRKFIGNSDVMGDLDTQIFKEKYKTKLEIPEGRGLKTE